MANKDTNSTENTTKDPLFDLDLAAEDADGKAIAPADLLAKAGQPVLVTWTVGTGKQAVTHKAVLDLTAVSYELWMSDSNWREEFLIENGITGQEDLVHDQAARDLVRGINAQVEESPEWWRLKAQIALAAIARDKHGLPLITVPQVRKDASIENLTSTPNFQLFGRKIINAIGRELNSFFV